MRRQSVFRKKLNFGKSTNVKIDKDDNGEYGENCQKPDSSTSVQRTDKEKELELELELEQETRCQSNNGTWMEERSKLLTVA